MYYRIILSLLSISMLYAKVRVVSSTTDLAAITREIGGDKVTVQSIARGNQDPHYVEILPSYMLKVKRADIYLKVGAELDLWADQIIDGSRNTRLQVVDCSQDIQLQEVPTTKINASMGDVHSFGNPHYWLDPANGIRIAEGIARALSTRDPENARLYDANLAVFRSKVEQAMESWKKEYASLVDAKIIYYHNSWPYFNSRFGLVAADFVEPKPRIMPTPTHIDELVKLIQNQNLKIIGMEPYFSRKAPDYLAAKTGITVVKLAQSVGAVPGTDSYLDMIAYNLRVIHEVLFP